MKQLKETTTSASHGRIQLYYIGCFIVLLWLLETFFFPLCEYAYIFTEFFLLWIKHAESQLPHLRITLHRATRPTELTRLLWCSALNQSMNNWYESNQQQQQQHLEMFEKVFFFFYFYYYYHPAFDCLLFRVKGHRRKIKISNKNQIGTKASNEIWQPLPACSPPW